MRGVAGGATFAQRLVFKHIRTTLGWMAAEAIVILRHQAVPPPARMAALVWRMTQRCNPSGLRAPDDDWAVQTGRAHPRGTGNKPFPVASAGDIPGGVPAVTAGGYRAPGRETIGRFDVAAGIRVEAARAVAGFTADISPFVALAVISRAWSAVLKSRQITS